MPRVSFARWSVALLLLLGGLAAATRITIATQPVVTYSAQQTGDVVTLADSATQTSVSILPSVGNMAFQFRVKGRNVFRWPFASVEEFKAKPGGTANPFLAPWANRLDENAFYANGKRYAFDMSLGNIRATPLPIHGLLQTASQWEVVDVRADASSARLTSRLDFAREPNWVKQWPFPHTIEITHVLRNGQLEVQTAINNTGREPMPISIGFHPYFELTDSPRDEWTIAVGARTRWLLAPAKVPTGETEPIEKFFPNPKATPLKGYSLDDVFGDLVRDADGRATMTVTGKSQRLDVVVGPNYRAVVIFSPAERDFICFEPMVAITNALNLAHKGIYKELQSVAPGQTWRESFWVRPSGF